MKKGDLRRGQILDTAEALFFEQGYDRTSIQDILDRLNISKGGFYHYFDAKETVLKEICERRWIEQFEKLQGELYTGRKSSVDKLNLILRQTNIFEAEDSHFAALILKICYRDKDASMRDHRRRDRQPDKHDLGRTRRRRFIESASHPSPRRGGAASAAPGLRCK